jgi:molybdopterin-guanine dinucleotide biosynthesis protein A
LNISRKQIPGVTGIVLAGGKSSRLGREKALERIGDKSLIENAIDSLIPVSQEILVVTSGEQFDTIASVDLKAKIIVDMYPGAAALGGIYTGLASASTFYGLVVACDMPFLNSALLHYLIKIAPGFDIVAPRVRGKLELLHAVYSKNCLSTIKRLLDGNILQVLQLLDLVKTRYVTEDELDKFDPEHLSFFNINTLNDLVIAKELVARKRQFAIMGKDKLSNAKC